MSPSTWNFGSKRPHWSEIADFRSIFVRSASAVTPSEKVQLILIGSPLRAFQWAQDGHRTLSLRPQRGLNNAKCQKIEQYAAITRKRHEIGWQLLLITNRKSHTGFRLIPTSMTLNDLERCNSPFCVFSPNSIALLANYVIVVADSVRKILSPINSLPLLAITNPPCSAVSLR